MTYVSRYLDPTTIERLTNHLRTLLDAIAEDADRTVTDLPMLTEAEIHRLLVGWNGSETADDSAVVPELLQAQVARTPDAVAMNYERASLTYAELNAWANRLAQVRRFIPRLWWVVWYCLQAMHPGLPTRPFGKLGFSVR